MKQVTNLKELYTKSVYTHFTHAKEGGGDYCVEQKGNTLYIYFEGSDGKEDWLNNFNFFAKPYKGMKHTWRVHRGFLKIWKGMEDDIKPYLMNESVEHVIIAGFSQGAALALLCHEWCSFNRPDLADTENIEGYGFGHPRVVWGRLPKAVKERFKGYTVITCKKDIVTHLPPVIFFFKHVGDRIKVGSKAKYGPIEAHMHYAEYLNAYQEELSLKN